MANTPQTRAAARKALAVHAKGIGNQSESEETQIVDLIADLLLLLPGNYTATLVASKAIGHAIEDRRNI